MKRSERHEVSRRIAIATGMTVAAGLLLAVPGTSTAAGGEATGQRVDADWAAISAGSRHSCGIRTNHTLWCWGWNRAGQLGLGDLERRTSPTRVGTRTDWVGIVSSYDHTCATRSNHTLWCWGSGRNGQLGLGDTTGRDTPTRVGTGADWAVVSAAGFAHTCGIRTDHTLWCWGNNANGQLGLGGTVARKSPAQVGTGTHWTGVKAGDSHTCATRTNHTLWCWGYNANGQLGLGDTTDRTAPTRVGTDADWTEVGAGDGYHTCGVRTDHTLWCWGYNGQGQLGVGNTTGRTVPTRVGSDTDWAHVIAGHRHTCATRTDHTLWCWGHNDYGQLGLGDTVTVTIPTEVGTGTDWELVGAGDRHTCAIRTDQTLWCWGRNYHGQLGLGHRHNRLQPRRV